MIIDSRPRAALLAWAVFAVGLGSLYAILPLYADQYWYQYVSASWLAGELPYVDVGDFNYPGAGLLHAAGLILFGHNAWSFRMLDYLLLLVFVATMGVTLARRRGGAVAWVFAVLYPLVYVTTGTAIAGQRDLLASHFGLLGGCCLLARQRGGKWPWMVVAGLALLASALLKPTFAGFVPLLVMVDLAGLPGSSRTWRRMIVDHGVIVGTMALGSALLLLIGWRLGVLPAWYEMTVVFNADVYTFGARPTWSTIVQWLVVRLATYWPLYTIVAVVGLVRWIREGDRPLLALLLADCAMALGSTVLQARMWDYHLAAMLPAAACLMANALAWPAGWRFSTTSQATAPVAPPRWSLALTALLLLITVAAVGKKLVGVYRVPVAWELGWLDADAYRRHYGIEGVSDVISYVKSHTDPTDRIWVWCDAYPEIYFESRRMSASRFAIPYMLARAVPPLRVADKWNDEVRELMRNQPPKLIIARVAQPTGGAPVYEFPSNSGDASQPSVSPVLARALREDYRLAARFESLEVHERIP